MNLGCAQSRVSYIRLSPPEMRGSDRKIWQRNESGDPQAGIAASHFNGADEGTRTPTPLQEHGPEPCASTNFATSARIAVNLLAAGKVTGPL